MTIGPDPMTSTDSMSVRRGLTNAPTSAVILEFPDVATACRSGKLQAHGRRGPSAGLPHVAQSLEQSVGVFRAGRGLGVVLHAGRKVGEAARGFDHVGV